jgi:hypothetical protein
MTEQELRHLVRQAIAQVRLPPSVRRSFGEPAMADPTCAQGSSVREHASHALFVIPAQGETCIIEPAVTCNHCGYCKSLGH